MAYIGDYLGQLLAEVTMARMQADIEAVRIAELYSSHPLLKNMPVPRFRLPSVDIDLPVVVKKMEESRPGESPRGTPSLDEIRKAFDSSLSAIIKEQRIKLTAEQQKNINEIIDNEVKSFPKPNELGISTTVVANRLATNAAKAIQELGIVRDSSKISLFKSKLETVSNAQFQNLLKPPSRLEVLVTTSEIKEAGPKENITVLHLTIKEEAFEWTSIETPDGTKNQLVIE